MWIEVSLKLCGEDLRGAQCWLKTEFGGNGSWLIPTVVATSVAGWMSCQDESRIQNIDCTPMLIMLLTVFSWRSSCYDKRIFESYDLGLWTLQFEQWTLQSDGKTAHSIRVWLQVTDSQPGDFDVSWHASWASCFVVITHVPMLTFSCLMPGFHHSVAVLPLPFRRSR